MKKSFSLLLIFIFFSILSEYSEAKGDFNSKKKVLELIADFADRTCQNIPLKGSGEDIDIYGETKIELSGLFKSLANLGIKGEGKYNSSSYEGVLREDLSSLVKNRNDCKLDILKLLKKEFLSNSENPFIDETTTLKKEVIGTWKSEIFYENIKYSDDVDITKSLFFSTFGFLLETNPLSYPPINIRLNINEKYFDSGYFHTNMEITVEQFKDSYSYNWINKIRSITYNFKSKGEWSLDANEIYLAETQRDISVVSMFEKKKSSRTIDDKHIFGHELIDVLNSEEYKYNFTYKSLEFIPTDERRIIKDISKISMQLEFFDYVDKNKTQVISYRKIKQQ